MAMSNTEGKEAREPLMNCDLCNVDYPESSLISLGNVMWTGITEMEMFLCEECAQKASNAFKKRKEKSP